MRGDQTAGSILSVVLAFCCCGMVAAAGDAKAEVTADAKSGALKLRLPERPDGKDAAAVEVKLGRRVTAVAKLRAGTFMKKSTVVFGDADVVNTSDRPMFYAYHLAFFDAKGGLVGCGAHSFASHRPLEPGGKIQVGVNVPLPKQEIERIASYQIRLIESDKPIGGVEE